MNNLTESPELPGPEALSLIGTVFAERYLIEAVVGQGGMGVVYKAKHLHMDRPVAIKMLLPGFAASKYKLGRFHQEARAASALDHANIVTAFDFGISADQTFLVMDYIEGQSLSTVIQECRRLTQKRTLAIMTQVCEALAHAHDKGVVHRDIKDSNIMLVASEGDADMVKLVDFGLAKLLGPASHHASLTETGQIIGSPCFMSPEQCRGVECDSRSDIYSLGCVMFRCLTGSPPFIGASPIETIQMHVANLPPAMKSLVPDIRVSRELELIINKCLFKDPNHRYQTVEELLADLRAVPEPGNSSSHGAQAVRAWQDLSRAVGQRHRELGKGRQSRHGMVSTWLSLLLLFSVACAFTAMSPMQTEPSDPWENPNQAAVQSQPATPPPATPPPAAPAPAAPAPAAKTKIKALTVQPNQAASKAAGQPQTLVLGPTVSLNAPAPVTAVTSKAAGTTVTTTVSTAPATAAATARPAPRTTLLRKQLHQRLEQAEQAGSDSPLLLPVLIELSVLELSEGNQDGALAPYRRALQIYQNNVSTLGTNNNIRESMCNLSWKLNDLDHVAGICTGNIQGETPNWLTSTTPGTTPTPDATQPYLPAPNPIAGPLPDPPPGLPPPGPFGRRWRQGAPWPGKNPSNMGGPWQ